MDNIHIITSASDSSSGALSFNNEDLATLEELSKSTGVKYSEEQKRILTHRGGMCILACAGSGKTTILTHLIAKRIKSGEIPNQSKLLCTTYSKSGADEMESRLKKLLGRLGIQSKVTVKTMHATYLMILKHFGFDFKVLDNATRFRYIREACKQAEIALGDEDLQTIDSLLSYQVNNLMSDDALVKSYVYTLDNVSLQQYTTLRQSYNQQKNMNGQLDFDDMQLYIYTYLVNQQRQDMLAFCHSMWTDFYIDEAQDISRIQFMILRKMVKDPSRLVFIGDDDQCIYQWRGADPNIILNICGYYDIEKFVLSTNYRCAGEIVKHAAIGIKNNQKRSEKTMHPYNEGGQIKIYDVGSDDLYKMTIAAYKHISKLLESREVEPGDIAVLSRNNQHLGMLNNMLFKNGIFCTTAPEMRMTRTSIYKDIKNLMELANNTYNVNVTKDCLWRVCAYLGTTNSKYISDFQNSSSTSLKDTIGYILTKFSRSARRINWSGNLKIPAKADLKVSQWYNNIKNDTELYLVEIYNILCLDNYNERFNKLAKLYLSSTSFMYRSGDRRRAVNGYLKYISSILNKLGYEETLAFLRMSEQYEEGSLAVPGAKISMSTMHGAKGREWKYVVLLADDNLTFPSFEGIVQMIKDGVSISDISNSLDEDRRLHYVAMTRAKNDLTIFTNRNNISVYTLEALSAMPEEYSKAPNANIISMANSGGLYDDIIENISKNIVNKESTYYYEI